MTLAIWIRLMGVLIVACAFGLMLLLARGPSGRATEKGSGYGMLAARQLED
jgi:hypothetical protein